MSEETTPMYNPFDSWKEYYKAFTQSLQGDIDCCEFPEYNTLNELYNIDVDEFILRDFLQRSFDPQEGLDGLCRTYVDGFRYSYEVSEWTSVMIRLFLDHGARLNAHNVGLLLKPVFWTRRYFEDDMVDIHSKGSLYRFVSTFPEYLEICDTLVPYSIRPSEIDTLVPTYWENMIDCTGALSLEYEDYQTAYYMALLHAALPTDY